MSVPLSAPIQLNSEHELNEPCRLCLILNIQRNHIVLNPTCDRREIQLHFITTQPALSYPCTLPPFVPPARVGGFFI